MKIHIFETAKEASQFACGEIENIVKTVKNPVFGLPTGSTPLKLYALMTENCKIGISYKNVYVFSLDEYVGFSKDDKNSYAYFLCKNLYENIDINHKNTFSPNGLADDLQKEAENYSTLIASMPPNLIVLGLGSNGHIAFNEPAERFIDYTHIVNLSENTRRDNSRLFPSFEAVPKQAVTMGIKDILSAKRIILTAFGKNKAQAVRAMLNGDVSPKCPASILRTHGNVDVLLDTDAAEEIISF